MMMGGRLITQKDCAGLQMTSTQKYLLIFLEPHTVKSLLPAIRLLPQTRSCTTFFASMTHKASVYQ